MISAGPKTVGDGFGVEAKSKPNAGIKKANKTRLVFGVIILIFIWFSFVALIEMRVTGKCFGSLGLSKDGFFESGLELRGSSSTGGKMH